MIIEEGLIAIGILALIAAMFLLRGKEKTSQPKQQVVHEPAVNRQVVDLARPSVLPKTQEVPFPVPQVSFPVSAANRQTAGLVDPAASAKTLVAFSVPNTDKEAVAFAGPSVMSETLAQVPFPVQTTMVVAQSPVWEIQPRETQIELTQPNQAQVAVVRSGQLTAQPAQGLPEGQMQSSIPSERGSLSPLKPRTRLLPNSPSIDQQMAELIADTWALQQQVAEIGRRLNYLSTCIQHSLASPPDGSDTTSRGNN